MTFLGNISEIVGASDFKIYHKVDIDSLYTYAGNYVKNYFSKSYKRVNFGSCSGRYLLMRVQPILYKFTVLETDSRASFPLV